MTFQTFMELCGCPVLDQAGKPISVDQELAHGQEVCVPAPMSTKYIKALMCESSEYGERRLGAKNGDNYWPVEKSKDERNIWVTHGCINLAALRNLELELP